MSYPYTNRILEKATQLVPLFNFTYRYVDGVVFHGQPRVVNILGPMYPDSLEIKGTTESNAPDFYLEFLLSIGRDDQLHTTIYDKQDGFNFNITIFPFLTSNISSSPTYGVLSCNLYNLSGQFAPHFFSPPAHLCAATYITEISLNVTLNKHTTQLNFIWMFYSEGQATFQ